LYKFNIIPIKYLFERKDIKGEYDAPVIERMKNAGKFISKRENTITELMSYLQSTVSYSATTRVLNSITQGVYNSIFLKFFFSPL